MNKKYPIIESLCEIQFIAGQPWDLTIPGLFYEHIKSDFPIKKQQVGLGISFQPQREAIQQHIEMSQRIQFHSRDETRLIQLGPDLLVINVLPPYPRWEKFRELILSTLDKYKAVAKPQGFKRVGLRYINKINIEKETIKLEDYFEIYPHIPQELPQVHGPFHIRVEFPFENNRDRLLLTIATAMPERPNTISIILDLDYVLFGVGQIGLDKIDGWLDGAHFQLNAAYKACLTTECKKIMGINNDTCSC